MGACREPLSTAMYPAEPWAPALTLPAGSGQQRQMLHPAASCRPLRWLELTCVKCFLGNAPHGDGPGSCMRQPRKCRSVVAVWPILPVAKIVDGWVLGGSGALSVWSTSRQRARLQVCGHSRPLWWPPFSVASSCPPGFSNNGSRRLNWGCRGLRSPGFSCLLWFGLCCSEVYPPRPAVWHASASTNMW